MTWFCGIIFHAKNLHGIGCFTVLLKCGHANISRSQNVILSINLIRTIYPDLRLTPIQREGDILVTFNEKNQAYTTYRIVVSTNTCYYSENQLFVQRSQYIRTKNPLHNLKRPRHVTNRDVLLLATIRYICTLFFDTLRLGKLVSTLRLCTENPNILICISYWKLRANQDS